MLPRRAESATVMRLSFAAPYVAALERATLPPPGLDEVRVATRASAVSAGTEMLMYRGQAPADLPLDATLASLAGPATYPMRYGYACVGVVEACGPGVDKSWLSRRVFAFEPHATGFVARTDSLIPVPDGLSDECAALLPNAETAANLLLDGAPLLGESVAVFGAGSVGLLATALLARFPLRQLVMIEPIAERSARAQALGAQTLHPQAPEAASLLSTMDLLFELSGNPAALEQAVQSAGYGARIVLGSWYGAKAATLHLGGHFHRNRVQIISSQVSTLAPALRGRWDKARRIDEAWRLLQTIDAAALISHRLPFARAADAYAMIDQLQGNVQQLVFTYAPQPLE